MVTVREPHPTPTVRRLRDVYLDFVVAAQTADGGFHNRRDADGHWADESGFDDHWGRAVWALGCASSCPDASIRMVALAAATVGMSGRSPSPRSMSYAAIGAAEVVRVSPGHPGASHLLADAATALGRPARDAGWPWPEPRLAYANAVLPEALLAIGSALGDDSLVRDGLHLLTWLVGVQTRNDQLSLVPAGGWQPGEPRPGFDQQPIEAAAIAEACRSGVRRDRGRHLASRARSLRGMVSRHERCPARLVRHRHGWRPGWAPPSRREREPGRGVDARRPVDAPVGARAGGSRPTMTPSVARPGRARRTPAVLRPDPRRVVRSCSSPGRR